MESKTWSATVVVCIAGLFANGAMVSHAAEAAPDGNEPVMVQTEGMPAGLAARVTEKGKEGSDALRRFIERTRMIHQLDYNSVAKKHEDTTVALPASESDKMIANVKR